MALPTRSQKFHHPKMCADIVACPLEQVARKQDLLSVLNLLFRQQPSSLGPPFRMKCHGRWRVLICPSSSWTQPSTLAVLKLEYSLIEFPQTRERVGFYLVPQHPVLIWGSVREGGAI